MVKEKMGEEAESGEDEDDSDDDDSEPESESESESESQGSTGEESPIWDVNDADFENETIMKEKFRKRMFQALQEKDLEGALDVIESEEEWICKKRRIKPPKGIRSPKQVSSCINEEDAYGLTPLMLACKMGVHRIVLGLLFRGADANYENKFGVTPLIISCQTGNTKAISALVNVEYTNKPALVNYTNRLGKTAFDHLEARSKTKVLPILTKARLAQAMRPNLEGKVLGKARGNEQGKESSKLTDATKRLMKSTIQKKVLQVTSVKFQKPSAAQLLKWIPSKERELKRQQAAILIQNFIRKYLAIQRIKYAAEEKYARERRNRKMVNYAIKVQRVYRSRLAKKRVGRLKTENYMASKIQAVFRGYIERRDEFSPDVGTNRKPGWVSKSANRRKEVKWEKAAKEATAVLIKYTRRRLAYKTVERMREQRDSAILIQRMVRGMLARHPRHLKNRKWHQANKLVHPTLDGMLAELEHSLLFVHLNRELWAGNIINRFLKPFATKKVAEIKSVNNNSKATKIQKVYRGYRGREKAELFRNKYLQKLRLVEDCLTVRGLVAKGNKGIIADPKMYGYCGKCTSCSKFDPRDKASASTHKHICACGHHITNHAVNVFRSQVHNDYYNNNRKRILPLNREYYSSVGVITDFDHEENYLKKTKKRALEYKNDGPPLDTLYRREKKKKEKKKRQAARQAARKDRITKIVEEIWELDEQRMAQKKQLMQEHKLRNKALHELELLRREKREAILEEGRRKNRAMIRMHQAIISERKALQDESIIKKKQEMNNSLELKKKERTKKMAKRIKDNHTLNSEHNLSGSEKESPHNKDEEQEIGTGESVSEDIAEKAATAISQVSPSKKGYSDSIQANCIDKDKKDIRMYTTPKLLKRIKLAEARHIKTITKEKTCGNSDKSVSQVISKIDETDVTSQSTKQIGVVNAKKGLNHGSKGIELDMLNAKEYISGDITNPVLEYTLNLNSRNPTYTNEINIVHHKNNPDPIQNHVHAVKERKKLEIPIEERQRSFRQQSERRYPYLKYQPTALVSSEGSRFLIGSIPEIIYLNKPTIFLGRGEQCDITVDSVKHPRMVSKFHAAITMNSKPPESDSQDDEYSILVKDMNSTNGTFVNGSIRVDAKHGTRIRHGDIVTFGTVIMSRPDRSSDVNYRLHYPDTMEEIPSRFERPPLPLPDQRFLQAYKKRGF